MTAICQGTEGASHHLTRATADAWGVQGAWKFGIEVQCHYGDLDINQHVNNVKYIEWCQDAREQYFHVVTGRWIMQADFSVVIRALDFTFERPLSMGDHCFVTARTAELRNTSFIQHYSVWRSGLVGSGTAVCVLTDKKTSKKLSIPADLRSAIARLENTELT